MKPRGRKEILPFCSGNIYLIEDSARAAESNWFPTLLKKPGRDFFHSSGNASAISASFGFKIDPSFMVQHFDGCQRGRPRYDFFSGRVFRYKYFLKKSRFFVSSAGVPPTAPSGANNPATPCRPGSRLYLFPPARPVKPTKAYAGSLKPLNRPT